MAHRKVDIDELILDIHATSLAPEKWSGVLMSISRLMAAQKAMVFSLPQTPGVAFWNFTLQMDPMCLKEYAAAFVHQDVWLDAALRRGWTATGVVARGDELIERRHYLNSSYFNEFLKRYDIEQFMNASLRGPPSPGGLPQATLSLYRGLGKDAFSDKDKALFERLARHSAIAVTNMWRARGYAVQEAVLGGTLDAVSMPLWICDREGRLIFTNVAGTAALQAGVWMRVIDNRLAIGKRVANEGAFARTLANIKVGMGFTVRLVSAAETIILATAPIPEESRGLLGPAAALALVWLVPMLPTTSPIDRFANLFELTTAEGRLLQHLADGEPLSEIARSLRISVHTARTQLKALQRKSGQRSQRSLLALLERFRLIDIP